MTPGKTTLLKAIALRKLANFPSYMTTLYVQQELIGQAESALQLVMGADPRVQELRRLEKALIKAHDGSAATAEQLEAVQLELQACDVDAAETRAVEILQGLDFTKQMYTAPTSSLSGGWRVKVWYEHR